MAEPGDRIIRPDPDPTARTVDLIAERVASLAELFKTRMDAVEKAQVSFQDGITRVPTQLQQVESGLKEWVKVEIRVIEGRFTGLDNVLNERKAQLEQSTQAARTAIQDALANTKEASGKTEANFSKRMDDLVTVINTAKSTTDDKITEIRDRVLSIEKTTQALATARSAAQATTNTGINAAGLALAVAALMIGLATSYLARQDRSPPPVVIQQESP